jgi:hypothetical protein
VNSLWGRQPVMVLAFVQAGLALAMGFGLSFTPVQMALVMAFVSAGIGLLTQTQVTPLATLPDHIAAQIVTASNASVEKVPIVSK